MLARMFARFRPLLRFFGLATRTDRDSLLEEAARLDAEVNALEARLDAMLEDAYGEAPVIRIHHGTPPHLH